MKLIPLPLYGTALLAIFLIILELKKYFSKEIYQTLFKTIFVTLIWALILMFSIFPFSAMELSRDMGLGETLNTLIFVGMVIIFMILYILIGRLNVVNQQLTEIVRYLAISEKLNKDNEG